MYSIYFKWILDKDSPKGEIVLSKKNVRVWDEKRKISEIVG